MCCLHIRTIGKDGIQTIDIYHIHVLAVHWLGGYNLRDIHYLLWRSNYIFLSMSSMDPSYKIKEECWNDSLRPSSQYIHSHSYTVPSSAFVDLGLFCTGIDQVSVELGASSTGQSVSFSCLLILVGFVDL